MVMGEREEDVDLFYSVLCWHFFGCELDLLFFSEVLIYTMQNEAGEYVDMYIPRYVMLHDDLN